MKTSMVVLGLLFLSLVKADDDVRLDLGLAQLQLTLPGKRSSQAPDVLIKRRDVLQWAASEDGKQHNADIELIRKLWDFKRPFRHVSGSFILTVSIARNVDFANDFNQYILWLLEDRLGGDGADSIEDIIQTEHINDTAWTTYYSQDGHSLYLRKDLGDNLILRVNLIYHDHRDEQQPGWDEKARNLKKQILNSLRLTRAGSDVVIP